LQKFWHTCPSEPGYLNAVDLNNPRPAPPDNGAIGGKVRPHGHTTSGHGKKLWMGRNSGWEETLALTHGALMLLLRGPTKKSEDLANKGNFREILI